MEETKIEIIEYKDNRYPALLRYIKNSPCKLYVEGNSNILNNIAVSIVGSRKCSNYGYDTAMKFAKDLNIQGITVVSGMAVGIDSAAHLGSLKINANTIAVLGSGFNNIFPKENIALYKDIIKNGGAVITEYEPNKGIKSNQFLERNRIVSGLSIGTLVVEAMYRSGTSVTATFAKQQGRKVFCIAHNENSKFSTGTVRLLKEGKAILVETCKDIIENYDFLNYKEIKDNLQFEDIVQEKIYNALKEKEQTSEQLSRLLKYGIEKINVALTILEMEDIIIKMQGGKFKIK